MLKPTDEYRTQLVKIALGDNMNFFCIEDCFALSFRQSVLSEIPELASVYKYNPPRNYPANLDQTKIITAASSDVDLKLSLYSPSKDAKLSFAERLVGEPASRFEYFRDFFERLEQQLSQI
jgi:hypothetical protein